MSRTIPLTRGYVTTVDDADYEWLNQWKWYAIVRPSRVATYAVRFQRKPEITDGKRRMVYMHRMILRLTHDDPLHVDHVNHDGLDNRRCNLRVCSRSQNIGNSRGHLKTSSSFKGVYFCKRTLKWHARISKSSSNYESLGYFSDEMDAARAYDIAARKRWGDFALLNLPDSSVTSEGGPS